MIILSQNRGSLGRTRTCGHRLMRALRCHCATRPGSGESDSNRRPLGYEPSELTTAPSRIGREGGIRTPGSARTFRFRDGRIQPDSATSPCRARCLRPAPRRRRDAGSIQLVLHPGFEPRGPAWKAGRLPLTSMQPGQGERNRTPDFVDPNHALCLAELHPDGGR